MYRSRDFKGEECYLLLDQPQVLRRRSRGRGIVKTSLRNALVLQGVLVCVQGV